MQVNRISNINLINTNFRASAVSKDMESQNAILMLREHQLNSSRIKNLHKMQTL